MLRGIISQVSGRRGLASVIARDVFNSPDAAKPIGHFAHACAGTGRPLYLSQIIGKYPNKGNIEPGVREQTKAILANLRAILNSVGVGLDQVTRVKVYLRDMEEWEVVNKLMKEEWSSAGIKPAAVSVMEVSGLSEDASVMMEGEGILTYCSTDAY